MDALQVINSMLGAVGQLPTTSVESTHPDVLTAVAKFNTVNEAVQSRGWWFNTDKDVTLVPDIAGEIILPSNLLSVDVEDRSVPYIQRGGKLYNPATASGIFSSPVKCRIVSLLDFNQLPSLAALYIMYRCMYEYFLDFDGEQVKTTFLHKNMDAAFIALNREELKVQRYNRVDNPLTQRMWARVRNTAGFRKRY